MTVKHPDHRHPASESVQPNQERDGIFLPLVNIGNGAFPRWIKVLVTYGLHFGPGLVIAIILIFADLGIITSDKSRVYSQMQDHFKAQYLVPEAITKQTKLLRAICRNTARMTALLRHEGAAHPAARREIETLADRLQAQCDEI